jgi:hypothetical protein
MDTNLDRQARTELRTAKKTHAGQVPDHVLNAIEIAAEARADRKDQKKQRNANVRDYFFARDRLARLAPAHCAATSIATGILTSASHSDPWSGFVAAPITAGIIWLHARRDLDTPNTKIYAATVIGYAGLWSTAIAHGLAWDGVGNAALVTGAAILSAPWAYKHLWRWQIAPPPSVEQPVSAEHSWFREAWETYRPTDAEMIDEIEIRNGRQAKLVAPRGTKSVEDILAKAALIRSTYDPSLTILEPVGARTVVLTVLEREEVLSEGPRWNGPTLNEKTGLSRVGRYPDGNDTHGQFWAPGSGATDFFVIGTKGSGKSAFLNRLASDLHFSELAVAWFSDPQEGQCMPEWADTADRYAIGGRDSIDANMDMLRALRRITYRRSRYFGREIKWIDAKGRERVGGKGYFDPTEADVNGVRIPLLHAFLDEMHALVRHPIHGAEAVQILGDIQRLSRKAGVGISWAGHSAGLSEMGGTEASIIRNLIKEGLRVAFRVGESIASYQLGLSEDPSQLPEYFANGSKTHGLGLIGGGPDRRTTQFRAEWVEDVYEIASRPPAGSLDGMSAEAADKPNDPDLAPKTFIVPGVGGQRPTPLIPSPQEKQTWADRILPLFADGNDHSLGAVISAFPTDASDRSIRWGVKKLVEEGLLATEGEKKPYRITETGRARLEQLTNATSVA